MICIRIAFAESFETARCYSTFPDINTLVSVSAHYDSHGKQENQREATGRGANRVDFGGQIPSGLFELFWGVCVYFGSKSALEIPAPHSH